MQRRMLIDVWLVEELVHQFLNRTFEIGHDFAVLRWGKQMLEFVKDVLVSARVKLRFIFRFEILHSHEELLKVQIHRFDLIDVNRQDRQ